MYNNDNILVSPVPKNVKLKRRERMKGVKPRFSLNCAKMKGAHPEREV